MEVCDSSVAAGLSPRPFVAQTLLPVHDAQSASGRHSQKWLCYPPAVSRTAAQAFSPKGARFHSPGQRPGSKEAAPEFPASPEGAGQESLARDVPGPPGLRRPVSRPFRASKDIEGGYLDPGRWPGLWKCAPLGLETKKSTEGRRTSLRSGMGCLLFASRLEAAAQALGCGREAGELEERLVNRRWLSKVGREAAVGV